MDLVIETDPSSEDADEEMRKYHFWIKDAGENKFESVVNTYYKFINLFVFMYAIDDREAF